jgi:ubiquitin C-terminal hydrolase
MFTDWCFRFFDSNGLLDLIRMLIDDDHQHFDPSRHGQYGYYAFNQIRLKIVRLVRAALSFDPACGVDMVGSQFSSPSPSIAKGTVFKLFDRDSSSENLLNQLYMVLISRVGDIREGCDSSADFQLDAALNLESQRLIVTCLHSWPALFSVPVSADHIRNWLESSLVQANSRLARLQGARAFSLIFRHHNREFNTSVQVSLQNIIESSPTWLKQRSEPFFLLIASMAEQSSADELYAPLFQTIINRLQSINSIERFDDPAQCDQELLGTLKIMRSLAKRHFHLLCASEDETPEGIIRFVYAKCLFHGLVLAQSVATRDAAFAFLFEASQHRADFVSTIVDQFLHDRIWKTKQSSLQFGYNPASFVKRPIPYVGLKNQGATCYMNSVMQQLFHVAAFRSAVLAANSEKSQNDQPAPSQDSLLYQCQHMFAAMQFSNRKSFDTISFCQSITDFDGQPLRLGEQKDANEFCALLFDKLESELKPTSCPSAVAESFGGVLIDQMVSRECAHIRQRDEPFNMISLDIKNKNTLLQSLDLFVAGDLLDGDNKYMCSTCNAKVSALKRSCFDSTRLPQSLLFHLKRFEFDFDAMRKNKINDSFEFPLEFSIEPYTSEGLRQRDAPNSSNSPMPALSPAVISTFYQYKLVGVVVHTGSADAGHYYSYIQDRNGAGWFQFNDSVVSNWDISELNDSCFGGSQNVEVFDQQSGSKVIRSQPKLHSAYMLVYERCADVDLIRSTVEAMKSTGSTESTSLSQDAVQAACVKQSAALNQMPESIMTLVQQDNAEFQTDTYLYDSSLASFLWNIANLNALGSVESFAAQSSLNAEHAVKLFDQTKAKVCQLMTLFTFRVLSRSRNFSMFCQYA